MFNELEPLIDQWYAHFDKGQLFYVVDIDEVEGTVELQHFDGNLEAISYEEWRSLDIELSEEPENWTGALDMAVDDDLGAEVTETSFNDWSEPSEDYNQSSQVQDE